MLIGQRMKTSSAKSKGRRFQQQLRNDLRELGQPHGLQDADVESRSMGCNGEDVILSPAARKLFDLYIEAKNVEKLNVPSVFWEHFEKYKAKNGLKVLAHSKNRSEPLATIRWVDFLTLIKPKDNVEPKQGL